MVAIGNEDELREIFRMDINKLPENFDLEIKRVDVISAGMSYKSYEADKLVSQGYFDIETWNKIRDFEINNPEKIKMWREEDEESRRDWNRWRDFFNKKRNETHTYKEEKEKTEKEVKISPEKELDRCYLLHKDNKFVLSVKAQYERYGRISPKQLEVLKRIIE